MDSEGYSPQQDPEYLEFLDQRRLERERALRSDQAKHPPRETAKTTGYVPRSFTASREFVPQTTDKNGVGWDKSVQQGHVYATIQKSYESNSGTRYNGQIRVVVKDYKGNEFVAVENWKPHVDDVSRRPDAQKHEWKGACNVPIKDLRELGQRLIDLADSLDGGVRR